MTAAACKCCANREAHVYDWKCSRCRARELARLPARLYAQSLALYADSDFADLVEQERERDALSGKLL